MLRDHGVTAPPIDVQMLAESTGAKIEFTVFEDEISGILLNKPGNVVIGVNRKHAQTRQRFSIAHEVAHLLLHPNAPTVHIDNVGVSFRAAGSTEPDDPREIEANAFAAELLMPREFIAADLHGRALDPLDDKAMAKLAERYAVSTAALNYRLVELGYVRQFPKT